MKKTKVISALVKVLALCAVIFAVSAYFIYDADIIGYVLVMLGFICIGALKILHVPAVSFGPDIVFGVIDNGILAAMAIFGGEIAGVAGAIVGG